MRARKLVHNPVLAGLRGRWPAIGLGGWTAIFQICDGTGQSKIRKKVRSLAGSARSHHHRGALALLR
jgi:hypothetical protein